MSLVDWLEVGLPRVVYLNSLHHLRESLKGIVKLLELWSRVQELGSTDVNRHVQRSKNGDLREAVLKQTH